MDRASRDDDFLNAVIIHLGTKKIAKNDFEYVAYSEDNLLVFSKHVVRFSDPHCTLRTVRPFLQT